jgi:hypothetical protein
MSMAKKKHIDNLNGLTSTSLKKLDRDKVYFERNVNDDKKSFIALTPFFDRKYSTTLNRLARDQDIS